MIGLHLRSAVSVEQWWSQKPITFSVVPAAVDQWLRCCAVEAKDAGSIPVRGGFSGGGKKRNRLRV